MAETEGDPAVDFELKERAMDEAPVRLVARTWWHWRRERDPEAAFYWASAVSASAGADPEAGSDPSAAAARTATEGNRDERTIRRPLGRVVDRFRSWWPE